jgi:hypothetical protein
MNAQLISNRLFDELAKCQSTYNMLSKGLTVTGLDHAAIRNRLEIISAKMADINRQLDLVRN